MTDLGEQMQIAGLRKENARAWAEADRLRAALSDTLELGSVIAGATHPAVLVEYIRKTKSARDLLRAPAPTGRQA